MIQITLPDGSVKSYAKGTTPMQVAQSISEGLARNVLSASFNAKTVETTTPLTTDGSLILYTWENPEGKKGFLAFFGTYFGTSHRRNVSECKTNYWTSNFQRILLRY